MDGSCSSEQGSYQTNVRLLRRCAAFANVAQNRQLGRVASRRKTFFRLQFVLFCAVLCVMGDGLDSTQATK